MLRSWPLIQSWAGRVFHTKSPTIRRSRVRLGPVVSGRLSTASGAADAAELPVQPDEPPPIAWTTHLLSNEQILKVDRLFHKILWLDMVETAILVDVINTRLGTVMSPKQRSALQRQMDRFEDGGMAGSPSSAEVVQEAKDEGPTLVDLKLTGFDAAQKIKVIKEVRAIAGLGLKEAKELVEGIPKVLQKGLKPEQAEELRQKLEAVGAQVELS